MMAEKPSPAPIYHSVGKEEEETRGRTAIYQPVSEAPARGEPGLLRELRRSFG